MSESAETARPLSELRPGERARVAAIDLPGAARGRVMELGLTVGVMLEVVRFAPLGDPMEIKVRGGHLSLRKAEAALIRVEPA
jgi:Fe2+ transport system protein FeoA